MIPEDLLERGLADAAGEYDEPAGAQQRIRELLAPTVEATPRRLPRPSRGGWLAIAAAAVVLLIVLPFALGGGHQAARSNVAGKHAAAAPGAGSAAGGGTGSSIQHRAPQRLASVPAPKGVAGAAGGPGVPSSGNTSGSGLSFAGPARAPGSSTDSSKSFAPTAVAPALPDRVIKTGELDLEVPKGQVTHTLDLLNGLAGLEHGYVADSRTSEGGYAPSGEITLRVPVAAFEDSVSRARHLTGVKVLALQTTGQDVTGKYVDLQARISALKATRETFLTLLARATTIGETLAVQQHVTDVQTSIEQLQGQLKVLANSSALSTLTVTVDQKVAATVNKPKHRASGLHRAFDRSVSRFVRGFEAIVGIVGPVLLALLLVGIAWLAATVGYRRLRRRMV